MKTRRSFLKKLAAFIAVVALAPEICFKKNFPAPRHTEILNLEELFRQFYAIKRQRELNGKPDSIELWMRGTPEEHAATRKHFQQILDKYGEGDVI